MALKQPRSQFQGTKTIVTPAYTGDAAWFIEAAGRIAKAMLREPWNKDLHALSRAFGQLATATRGFILRGELDETVAELRKQVLDMMQAGRYGARFTSGTNSRAEDASRPDDAVH